MGSNSTREVMSRRRLPAIAGYESETLSDFPGLPGLAMSRSSARHEDWFDACCLVVPQNVFFPRGCVCDTYFAVIGVTHRLLLLLNQSPFYVAGEWTITSGSHH